jgi:hypothetical protein
MKYLKVKEKKNVDATNELSEEELQFQKEIDKFWNVEYHEISPKSRGSNVIHFGKKNISFYCI